MYIMAGVMVTAYLILFVLSKEETVDFGAKGFMRSFYRMAMRLYKWFCIRGKPLRFRRQVEQDLMKLHPEQTREYLCTEYYVKKIALSLLICLAGTFLGAAVSVKSANSRILSDTGLIKRGTFAEGARDIELACSCSEGVQRFKLQVEARQFSESEIEELYREFCRELPEYILGMNDSLDKVSENLYLWEEYEGYPFKVTWESSNLLLVRSDGTVNLDNADYDRTQEVELLATISYGEWERTEQIFVKIVPPPLTEEEYLYRNLEKQLNSTESESRTEQEWKLPDSWQGQKLTWHQITADEGPLVIAGAIAVSAIVYLLADKDLHDEIEKRKKQMKRDYPDVVHKLVLYLGAGITIRGAFQRTADDYERNVAEGGMQCPVYEEMLYACRELKAGNSEGAAYEQFGKRTGLQEYIRLSTLFHALDALQGVNFFPFSPFTISCHTEKVPASAARSSASHRHAPSLQSI